jgi:hypothetical protein
MVSLSITVPVQVHVIATYHCVWHADPNHYAYVCGVLMAGYGVFCVGFGLQYVDEGQCILYRHIS